MRVGATEARASGPPRQGATAPADGESRALVAFAQTPAPPEPPTLFRQAPFLAQLIATREQLPQTRARRRAEPHEALAAYRAVAKLSGR